MYPMLAKQCESFTVVATMASTMIHLLHRDWLENELSVRFVGMVINIPHTPWLSEAGEGAIFYLEIISNEML